MVRKFFRNITRINRNNLDNPVIFVLPTYLPTYLSTYRSLYKESNISLARYGLIMRLGRAFLCV